MRDDNEFANKCRGRRANSEQGTASESREEKVADENESDGGEVSCAREQLRRSLFARTAQSLRTRTALENTHRTTQICTTHVHLHF